MMNSRRSDFFWPSYTDLMTSLFFIMLVLYVLTYIRLNTTIKLQKEKLAIIEAVEENLRPLKKDTSFFIYDKEYKRFTLAFDVKFYINQSQLVRGQLVDYDSTITNITKAGNRLKSIIDRLKIAKYEDRKLRDVSYILVIAGYASRTGEEIHNYELSYQRALALKNYWNSKGIDFENRLYKNLIDLQISGNGWGGLGRLQNDKDNQRFIIQIFPKIGDFK